MNEDELRSKINRMYSEADELEENAEKTQKCAAKMFREAESARRRGMSDEECFDMLLSACTAEVESILDESRAAKLHKKIYQLELEFYELKKLPPIGKEFKYTGGGSQWKMLEFWEKKDKIDLRDNLFKAHNGDVEAMRKLGECYYDGRGTFKNLDKARYWYKRAAARGDDIARIKLNDSYKGDPSPLPQFDPMLDFPELEDDFCTPPKKSQPSRKKSSSKKKSSSPSLFTSSQQKSSYDGNFSKVDPVLADLYNSEDSGKEESTVIFGDSGYNADNYKKNSDTHRKPKRSKYFGENDGDDDGYIGGE